MTRKRSVYSALVKADVWDLGPDMPKGGVILEIVNVREAKYSSAVLEVLLQANERLNTDYEHYEVTEFRLWRVRGETDGAATTTDRPPEGGAPTAARGVEPVAGDQDRT